MNKSLTLTSKLLKKEMERLGYKSSEEERPESKYLSQEAKADLIEKTNEIKSTLYHKPIKKYIRKERHMAGEKIPIALKILTLFHEHPSMITSGVRELYKRKWGDDIPTQSLTATLSRLHKVGILKTASAGGRKVSWELVFKGPSPILTYEEFLQRNRVLRKGESLSSPPPTRKTVSITDYVKTQTLKVEVSGKVEVEVRFKIG